MPTSASWLLTVPLGILLAVPGAAALVAGVRGRSGRLVRAGRLGVHGRAAASSDRAFAVANRVAAPVCVAAAFVFAVGAALVPGLRLPPAPTLVVFLVSLISGSLLLVAGGALGERAAAALAEPVGRPSGCDGCVCGSGGCAGLTRSATADAPAATQQV